MQTKIKKWGNSQGLCLPKSLLEDARLGVGDEVDIVVKDGNLLIAPARKIRGKYRLEALVAQIKEDYRAEEVDWGDPVGRETW